MDWNFCCFCIPSGPSSNDRFKVRAEGVKFQTDLMNASCVDIPYSCIWFCGQFIPCTCGLTQYLLRRKVLEYDMTKYVCCQGYSNCCGIGANSFGEQNCPDLCLCCEAHCCNGLAVSASRLTVMDRYELVSDACDYRLIWFTNCLQMLSCFCDILALIDGSFKQIAKLIDIIADLVYHLVTGCMTAQVSHEVNYQMKRQATTAESTYKPPVAVAVPNPMTGTQNV